VRRELEPGELVDHLVERFAKLGVADELAELRGLEVVVAIPRKVLLLDLEKRKETRGGGPRGVRGG
jgi:hypothetical protein